MKLKPIVFVAALITGGVFLQPCSTAGQQILHGHVPNTVASFHLKPIGRLPSTNRLNLAIALPLRNKESLTNLLQQIYDPASTNYHHYLTPEKFTRLFGPSESDYQTLIAFAKANGLSVTETYSNRALLGVSGSAAEIEKVLNVHMQVYQHPTEARTFYAPDIEPSLNLTIPVLGIGGLDNFVIPRPMNVPELRTKLTSGATPATGSAPDGFSYMGYDFRNAYVPGTTLTGVGQTVGLFQLDGYYPSDIAKYEQLTGLPNVTLQPIMLDGFSGNPGVNNVEVALDIEMVISMAPGLSRVIVYEGTNPLDVLNRMISDDLAMQLSSSWFWGAGVDDGVVDLISSQMFQEMAAQGQTFFQASGDDGAYYTGVSQWAGSPNVTLVGGTILNTSGPGGSWVSETTWPNGGGGFRPAYSIPTWQVGLATTANQASTTLRNVPDVAMVADFAWTIYNDGVSQSRAGTSIAAPLWAGFLALVNQQLTSNSQPTIGATMNPLIYDIGTGGNYASCFHDITSGNNENSGSPTMFSAVPGYDLCTGWGTPKGVNLINELSFLPDLTKNTDGLVTTVHAGSTLNPSITIGNQYCNGGYAATGPFHIGFYLSTSSTFANPTLLYEVPISSCSAGGTVTLNPSIPIGSSITPGIYYFGYKIDDQNEVLECNKNNNGIFSWTITVLPQQYTITASAGNGGTINPSGSLLENAGASQTFTASSNVDYAISQWLVDGGIVQNGGTSYTLYDIQANHTIQVLFTYSPNDFSYTTNNGTITITAYTGAGGALTIPSSITGLTVASIGDSAFQGNTNLTSVTIPNGVTSIGQFAFYQCSILTNVNIPSSVISIGDYAFDYCYKLEDFVVDNSNSAYSSPEGILFNKNQTVLVQFPAGRGGNYIIPDSVTDVGAGAFLYCTSLLSVTIPNSVTTIGAYGFDNCSSLVSVVIPDSVTSIGDYAFTFCTNLINVEIGNGVTSLGQEAFFYCSSLTTVAIGNSVNSIGSSAFGSCFSLPCITLPNSVIDIGDYAFSGCLKMSNAIIGSGVVTIGDGAFINCSDLTEIYFAGNAPTLGGPYVFTGVDNVTFFYLPGAAGWTTSFYGYPTMLWRPRIKINDYNLGEWTNGFNFNISWVYGGVVKVEACTNLNNPIWMPIYTNILTNSSFYFSDSQSTNYFLHFYRLQGL
jgi:subtilase family serine protease